jgi:hypothetical protein
MMGHIRGRWRVGALVALTLGLGACGSSGSSSSSATTSAQSTPTQTATQAATTASTSAATTTSTSAASPSSAGAAAPGTKLAVGQAATVVFHPPSVTDKSKDSTLKLAISAMKKGTLNDFNGIKLDASEKAGTPFYVHVSLTNLGPHPVDVNAASAAIEGVDSTGNTQQSVTFIGDFPPCPDNGTTTPLPPGKTFTSCLTYLVPGGIGKVAYLGTDDYINSPVTWSP